MGIIRFFTAFFLLIAILPGCQTSEAVEQPKIFGNLYVRYLQDGQQIKAEASFFEGDSAHTAQPISILGGVAFQGSGMESRNIQGKMIRYQYENQAAYPDQFSFQVQDESGQSHHFAAKMPPVNDFLTPDTISKTRETTLELQPAPGSKLEALALLFSDAEGKASLIEIPAPLSKKIPLTPALLSKLRPGTYQLYLVKKQRTFIEQGVYRVYFDLEFYTEVKRVVISDL